MVAERTSLCLAVTLFSAGGTSNLDLPHDSSYHEVTPMALTIEHGPEGTKVLPWSVER